MNTLNVKVKKTPKNFKELYKMATDQFLCFMELEGIKDWEEFNFSIDSPYDQLLFKDLGAIRLVEELTEATEAIGNIEHFKEEITDSLNFFLTLYICLGKKYEDLPKWIHKKNKPRKLKKVLKDSNRKELYYRFYLLIEKIGLLNNKLKNRPWTQANFLVDLIEFEERLLNLWEEFNGFIIYLGIGLNELMDMFARKYWCNMYRISTGY